MRRKFVWTAGVIAFLGTSYVAISSTASDLMAQFMIREECSMTVSDKPQVHYVRTRPITLQEFEEAARRYDSSRKPVQQLPPHDATHPVGQFLSQYADPDSLAEGVLRQNGKEKFWNEDRLFRAIERSGKCSRKALEDLQDKHCSCSHQ